jgi:hypothetical protein
LEDQFIFSLDRDKLHFVNREDAVNQLRDIHRINYNRTTDHAGLPFQIPICDHVIGLGKSEFGRNYIRQCRAEMAGRSQQLKGFNKVLYDCHSIEVMFSPGKLTDKDSMDRFVMIQLSLKLRNIFEKTPACVSKSYESSSLMLADLTQEIGPIFIVLDELGIAFERDGDSAETCRKRFLMFCDHVLSDWLLLQNVFFLVLGRALFFTDLGRRPENAVPVVPPSRHIFRRLPLRLLRESSIQVVLKNSLRTEDCGMTLAEYFDLDDAKLDTVAKHLFSQTNGHPRTLLLALKKCESYQDLIEYVEDVDIEHWDLFCQHVIAHKSSVLEILSHCLEGRSIDLSRCASVQGKSISYDEIAANALISWDGSINEATVYALPCVQAFLTSLLLPLNTFLADLSKRPSSIPLNYPDAFELLLMKRFQEIFSTERIAKDALAGFFNTEQFGNTKLSLPSDFRPGPKITKIGQKHPTLTSKTADPDAWPRLLAEIDTHDSICLKPASQSVSPNIIFAAKGWLDSKSIRVRILIAAKNYQSTEMTEAGIEAEVLKADQMFRSTSHGQSFDGKALNVLFICSTNYGETVRDRFVGAKCQFFKKGIIDEVVVLDLTTKECRALFFGVSDGEWESRTIEDIISKVATGYSRPLL